MNDLKFARRRRVTDVSVPAHVVQRMVEGLTPEDLAIFNDRPVLMTVISLNSDVADAQQMFELTRLQGLFPYAAALMERP